MVHERDKRGLGVMQLDRGLPDVAVLGGDDPLGQFLHQRQLALFARLREIEGASIIEEVLDRARAWSLSRCRVSQALPANFCPRASRA